MTLEIKVGGGGDEQAAARLLHSGDIAGTDELSRGEPWLDSGGVGRQTVARGAARAVGSTPLCRRRRQKSGGQGDGRIILVAVFTVTGVD